MKKLTVKGMSGFILLTIIGLSLAAIGQLVDLMPVEKYAYLKSIKATLIFFGLGLAIVAQLLDASGKEQEKNEQAKQHQETIDSLNKNLQASNQLLQNTQTSIDRLNLLMDKNEHVIQLQNNILTEQVGSNDTPKFMLRVFNNYGTSKVFVSVVNVDKYPLKNVRVRFFDYALYEQKKKEFHTLGYRDLFVIDCEKEENLGQVEPGGSLEFGISVPDPTDENVPSVSPMVIKTAKPYITPFTIWWGRNKSANYKVVLEGDPDWLWQHRPKIEHSKERINMPVSVMLSSGILRLPDKQ